RHPALRLASQSTAVSTLPYVPAYLHHSPRDNSDLPPFPTRRSSDLVSFPPAIEYNPDSEINISSLREISLGFFPSSPISGRTPAQLYSMLSAVIFKEENIS